MTNLPIPQGTNRVDLAEYCHTNISPRRYYLHNQVGGEGWRIYSLVEPVNPDGNWKIKMTKWYVDVDCEQQAILIRLRYGA
jgi:hypothetical protein